MGDGTSAASGVAAPAGARAWRILAVAACMLCALKLWLAQRMRGLPLMGDEAFYLEGSRTFFANYWSEGDFWAPLQTAFLALLRALVPEQEIVPCARLVQVAVHTVTGGFVFGIGRELKDARVGLVAALAFLLLPEVVSMSFLLFSETWSLFWSCGGAWAYLVAVRSGALPRFALAGFAFGVAALFRAVNLYVLPFVLLHLWLVSASGARRKLAAAATLALALAAPVSVQSYKNYRVYGDLLLVETSTGRNVWKSQNVFPPPTRLSGNAPAGVQGGRPRVEGGTPGSRQRAELANALRFVAANPGLALARTFHKVRDLFHPSFFAFKSFAQPGAPPIVRDVLDTPAFRALTIAAYVATMLLAAAGLLFARERNVRLFTGLVVAYHVAVTGFFFSLTRYRLAFVPLLIVFAAWSLCARSELWQARRSRRATVLAALWVLMLASWIPDLPGIVRGPPRGEGNEGLPR
jgi:hypothetical protein